MVQAIPPTSYGAFTGRCHSHANVINMSFHLPSYLPEVANALSKANLAGMILTGSAHVVHLWLSVTMGRTKKASITLRAKYARIALSGRTVTAGPEKSFTEAKSLNTL